MAVWAIDDLDLLLPEADVVFVIAPHTPQTEGLFDARRLALLPDDALLVNVARGPLVDTDALLAETSSGRLRAALDVIDPEPLPADHPLWPYAGVFISPHVGGASTAFFPRADRLIAAQLRRFAAGEELENIIDTGRARRPRTRGPTRMSPNDERGDPRTGLRLLHDHRRRAAVPADLRRRSRASPSSTSPPGTAGTRWWSPRACRRPGRPATRR